MEHWLQKSKCSIFHNIFKYMIFQRSQKALLWSKGLTVKAPAKNAPIYRLLKSSVAYILSKEADSVESDQTAPMRAV